MSQVRPSDRGDLWAITCLFNPIGYTRRLDNYRVFRRQLGVPLAAVELTYGEDRALTSSDADILVQLRGGDVLWQKERLLNVALRALPPQCRYVAWIDCDVVFERPDWHVEARRELERHVLIQLFEERCELAADCTLRGDDWGQPLVTSRSAGARIRDGTLVADDLRATRWFERGATAGLAWAARRSALERHGIYDACVVGSGDRAILCAALGEFEIGAETLHMSPRQRAHYLAWAKPFYDTLRGSVATLGGRIGHLWHGELENRRYGERLERLAAFEFDPARDIAQHPGGAWRWSSDKAEMHRYVRGYFESRREDG